MSTPRLTEVKQATPRVFKEAPVKEVPGLYYTEDVIDAEEEVRIINFINSKPWRKSLKLLVQQYGGHYNYTSRTLDLTTSEIPEEFMVLAAKLKLPKPDNIIVNRYLPGEGIAAHTDSIIFGDTIASLSLMSEIGMEFKRSSYDHFILLKPRSLFKLTGEARYQWTHGITARKSDNIDGKKYNRSERISITFRTVE